MVAGVTAFTGNCDGKLSIDKSGAGKPGGDVEKGVGISMKFLKSTQV